MNVRPTQTSSYQLVQAGLNLNFAKLVRAQEMVSSGKRILRPSDDPIGASTALALRRQLGDVGRYLGSVSSARPMLELATSALNDASGLLADAKQLVVSGMNGTLNDSDRAAIATQLRGLKERLMELANSRSGDAYLFGGTTTNSAPFEEVRLGGENKVIYNGNGDLQKVMVGLGVELAVNLPGDDIFSPNVPHGMSLAGLSGAAPGTTANMGTGFETLSMRHDATTGTLGAGITLANGGADDTFLGLRDVVVDVTAGTVRFGNGPTRPLPDPASAGATDVRLVDENGAEVHLDFSGWDGTATTNTLSGAGSMSLDGSTWTTIDFSATDVELENPATGSVVHIDATGITRAADDLVTFSGQANLFDVLEGMASDLENSVGLPAADVQRLLGARMEEFDRGQDTLLAALGTLGSRSERLLDADGRLQDLETHLASLLSSTEDADLATTILEMTKAEQTLQLAQATGSRLLNTSLLNYLR